MDAKRTIRRIGSLDVSLAGLGCNNFGMRIDERRSREVVEAALDAGITHFDTADVYGGTRSEEFLGRALGARRNEVVIATKFGMLPPPAGLSSGHPEWVGQACENSLKRLGTDRIDLYWLHHPDPQVPVGDTLEALGRLVDVGKVREIGCSNFSAEQLVSASAAASQRGVPAFATAQNEYSLLARDVEAEVVPACVRIGMTLVPYFPLASGMLTGKYRRGEEPPAGTRIAALKDRLSKLLAARNFDAVARLDAYARERGHTLLDLALSWLASSPVVSSVIAGATSAEQVRANATATTAWHLDAHERAEVAALVPT